MPMLGGPRGVHRTRVVNDLHTNSLRAIAAGLNERGIPTRGAAGGLGYRCREEFREPLSRMNPLKRADRSPHLIDQVRHRWRYVAFQTSKKGAKFQKNLNL